MSFPSSLRRYGKRMRRQLGDIKQLAAQKQSCHAAAITNIFGRGK
jgi:hypothetical protein